MSKRVMAVVAFVAGLVAGTAQAQYASVDQHEANKERAQEQAAEAARQKYKGRRFWVEPNPKAITRLEFVETISQYSFNNKKFVLTEPASFTVTGFERQESNRYVEVTFEDGKIAYLPENILFHRYSRENDLFDHLYSLKETREHWIEYILPMSPDDLRAALKKKRSKDAAAAAAWKARGGVSIGMTADQVRGSNWGKPSSINRSTGSYGVHEQWVYGGGNYIYFQNGRVSSIQN